MKKKILKLKLKKESILNLTQNDLHQIKGGAKYTDVCPTEEYGGCLTNHETC